MDLKKKPNPNKVGPSYSNSQGLNESSPIQEKGFHMSNDTTENENMNKLEAIKKLKTFDHGILKTEAAQELATLFGLEVRAQTFTVGEDRVADGPSNDFEGIAAHVLAEQIANSLSAEYLPMFGIGSRLRIACEATEKALEFTKA